jgi:threonine aldolase
VLSITQSTESGTLYTTDEIGALCDEAHRLGMLVHLDGARIANAAAALGGIVRAFTSDVGVDVISFGGTKNGLMYGEAVVFCRPELAARAAHVRKQLAQLPSKVRYISAQFLAILADGLWLRLAEHANVMATQLAAAVAAVPGAKVARAPAVNAVFVELPGAAISPLQEWCFFWVWDPHRSEVRWMTAWDTTPADIDAFVAGVRAVLASS